MFACEHEGIEPDLICIAKGIADGLPLSAVTGRAEIMDAPHPSGIGGTFGGNPVACAAALATIATIEADGLIERARQIERLMKDRLQALQAGDDRIGDVRGRGAMIAVEFVKPDTAEPDAELTNALAAAAHAAGVIVLTAGIFGNVVRFLPPLTISDELLSRGSRHPVRAARRALMLNSPSRLKKSGCDEVPASQRQLAWRLADGKCHLAFVRARCHVHRPPSPRPVGRA